MNNRKYMLEKLILGGLKALISCLFAGSVIWCWIYYFNQEAPKSYYRLGHYFMFALVLISYIFIARVYGAFNIGTSSATDVAFSQIITIFIWQIVCYFIFSLVSFRLVEVGQFLIMFALFSVFAILWAIPIQLISRIS